MDSIPSNVGVGPEVSNFRHLCGESDPAQIIEYGRFISEHYAREDGSPVPPTGLLIKSAHKEGLGPSTHVVSEALGIVALQSALGFTTPAVVRDWTRDQYIENGVWLSQMLGAPDEPSRPLWSDLEKSSVLYISPSVERITNVFGGLDEYNDAIGFVTPATLDRWSDQDWIDNGRWLSQLLGSDEKPVMPVQSDMRVASSLSISPTLRAIYAKFGSLPDYQKALGFQPRDRLAGYEAWTRDQYIENGVWLSHAVGTSEHPVVPTSRTIDQASQLQLCPPESAILKRFGRSLARYQDALGFVTSHTLERWTERDWVQNGRWVSHMLGGSEEPVMPTELDLMKGSAVGVSPNADMIRGRFGSMMDYQEKLGFTNPNIYATWNAKDYIDHLKYVVDTIGRKPGRADYEEIDGPSARAIQKRFGSLARFHELAGFPDYANWRDEQLLAYGIRWAVDHGNIPPRRSDIKKMRNGGKAPSDKKIDKVFGSFEDYCQIICDSLPLYEELDAELDTFEYLPNQAKAFLMSSFVPSSEFREQTIKGAQAIVDIRGLFKSNLSEVASMFINSRSTLRWDAEDYFYFAEKAFGTHHQSSSDQCAEAYAILENLQMAPFRELIDAEFGSLELFLKSYIDQNAQTS